MVSAKDLESGDGVERRCARRRGRGSGGSTVSSDAAHRGDERALHPDRAPDESLHRTRERWRTQGDRGGQVFREHISGPVVQAKCVTCHVAGWRPIREHAAAVRSRVGRPGPRGTTTCRSSRTSSRRWTMPRNFDAGQDSGRAGTRRRDAGAGRHAGLREHGAVPPPAGRGRQAGDPHAADAVRHGDHGAGTKDLAPRGA